MWFLIFFIWGLLAGLFIFCWVFGFSVFWCNFFSFWTFWKCHIKSFKFWLYSVFWIFAFKRSLHGFFIFLFLFVGVFGVNLCFWNFRKCYYWYLSITTIICFLIFSSFQASLHNFFIFFSILDFECFLGNFCVLKMFENVFLNIFQF